MQLRYPDFERNYPRLEVSEDHRGAITGTLEDIAGFALKFVVGSVIVTSGLGSLIFVGAEAASLAATGSLVPGARIVAGVLWLAGPYGTLYALAAEGVASIGIRSRTITDEEYAWADQVFTGTLPAADRIVITDSLGGNGRPFTFPRVDDKITVNLGPGMFDNPRGSQGTFIHELTHAWQIENTGMEISWLADALSTQLKYSLGSAEYEPGPAGPPWGDFNLEQQATIVERWFNGGQKTTDDYYRYIESNLRTGRA